jgi:hypothetical protein
VKKKILLYLRFIITFAFIFIIWWNLKDQINQLVTNIKLADKAFLIIAFCVLLSNGLIYAARLKMVFSVEGFGLDFKEALYLSFIGFFFNSFLPTAVGGDIAKAYYASEKFSHKKVESYAAVFADRMAGLVSIAIIASLALITVSERLLSFNTKIIIYSILVIAIFFIFFALNSKFASRFKFLLKALEKIKLGNTAKRAYNVFNNFKNHPKKSSFILLISIATQLVFMLVYFLLAKSLDLELSFVIFLVFIPIVMAASLIPSLGGTGPREGCFIALFSTLVGKTEASALALLWLGCFLGLSLIGGLIYMLSGYRYLSVKEIEKEMDYD